MDQTSTTERAKENLGLSTALLIGVILAFGWRPWTSSAAVSGDLQSYEAAFQALTTSLQDHPCCHARARTITWPADNGSKKTYPSIFDAKNQQRKQHRKIIRFKKSSNGNGMKKNYRCREAGFNRNRRGSISPQSDILKAIGSLQLSRLGFETKLSCIEETGRPGFEPETSSTWILSLFLPSSNRLLI